MSQIFVYSCVLICWCCGLIVTVADGDALRGVIEAVVGGARQLRGTSPGPARTALRLPPAPAHRQARRRARLLRAVLRRIRRRRTLRRRRGAARVRRQRGGRRQCPRRRRRAGRVTRRLAAGQRDATNGAEIRL